MGFRSGALIRLLGSWLLQKPSYNTRDLPAHLLRCGGVQQQDQAALLGVNPHELQQDAVYPHALRRHQQPVNLKQTEEHLRLKLQQRTRHVGGNKTPTTTTTRFLLVTVKNVS